MTDFSEEEKKVLIHDIVEIFEKMMENITTRKSPKNLGRSWCNKNQRSQRHRVKDTIFVNLLTGNQTLPAQPRDFRIKLSEEEKNIESHGLTDALKFMVRTRFLDHKKENFQFPVGRPRNDSEFSEERRGRKDSVYEKSQVFNIVDNMLDDPEIIKSIDKELDIRKVHDFLIYSFKAIFYQLKFCPDEFQHLIKLYERKEHDLHDADDPLFLAKELTPEKINELSKKNAKAVLASNKYNNKIVYTISTLMMYGDAYQ